MALTDRITHVGKTLAFCVGTAVVGLAGCDGAPVGEDPGDPAGGQGGRAFLSMGTAPIGGAFPVVGGAIGEVLNANKGENNWKLQTRGTNGSQHNIRQLDSGKLQLALSNSAISFFAVRGESGWEKKYNVRAIVTLAPNVAMFITKKGSGVKTLADLKGKRVVCGPSGAGFDMFIEPIVKEHGVTFADFQKLNSTQSGAVDMLGDGNADAAFLGGAVPTGAVTQACSTHDIHFVPFDEAAKAQLIQKYPFFQAVTIPQKKYSDLSADYKGMNVGSMHLITSLDQDEELIYQITKTIWENREAIAKKHPAGKFITEKNAARFTGTEFHPGAIRFYTEEGLWTADPGQGTGK